ncbi:Deoxyuridine 5'-triphosphate nucleotidohydrolase [Armadillidium vulgare]|nr:Deoxyuridine 5'-triphosphate nucleotidohydrolase [Armadillidium vulgare]
MKIRAKLHEATDGVQRQEAEKALVEFQSGTNAGTLSQCQLLLDRAQSSYSQYMAVTTLTKLVSRNPSTLTLQQRIQIPTHPKLVHYVTQGLVVLFARITKLGWFDLVEKDDLNWVFRNVIDDVSQFLQIYLYHNFTFYLICCLEMMKSQPARLLGFNKLITGNY